MTAGVWIILGLAALVIAVLTLICWIQAGEIRAQRATTDYFRQQWAEQRDLHGQAVVELGKTHTALKFAEIAANMRASETGGDR
jgi:hypothetical protein